MATYETLAMVGPEGGVRLVGVPFAPGTEVEVTIQPKRASADEFRQAWERVSRELRALPSVQSITEEAIQQEIAEYRAGR